MNLVLAVGDFIGGIIATFIVGFAIGGITNIIIGRKVRKFKNRKRGNK